MNPINFTDPFGLQEKEFQVMCMYPDNKLEDILIMQEVARRGYAKGTLALGIGIAMAPLSGPAIIAFVGSTLIYTGLDEYSERIKAGQSPYEARAGTIVNKMTLGLYPIIKGEDPGTGDAIEAKERVLRGMDWLGQFIAGASGYISGKLFFGMNPSTFQLMDEAFKKTTGQATSNFSIGENAVYQSLDEASNINYVGITNNLERRAAEHLRKKGITIDGIFGLNKLPRMDAKGVEQALIELHGLLKNGGTLINQINSISAKNPFYAEAIKRGIELLKNIGYPGF